MALVVLTHDPLDPPARLGAVLQERGHRLRVLALHEGDALPADLDDTDGVVVMGGSMDVDEAGFAAHGWMQPEVDYLRAAADAGVPMVGVCLGAQLLAHALGGGVGPMEDGPEVGFHPVKLAFPGTVDAIHAGQPWEAAQFHAHGHQVTELPPNAVPMSGSKACRTQGFCVNRAGGPPFAYGFQYHFEWTRRDIGRWLDGSADWLAEHDVDADAVRASLDGQYEMYRHLGDRLCERLAGLLFRAG